MRSTHSLRQIAAVGLCVLSVVSFARGGESAEENSPDPTDNAARLVHQALVAESQGDAALRDSCLREALRMAPHYAPARWQAGQIQRGSMWVTPEEAAAEVNSTGNVARYREEREKHRPTAGSQLALSNWCRREGLKQQERAHLFAALQASTSPSQTSAVVSRLGLVRYLGILMPAEQASQLRAHTRERNAAARAYRGKLASLEHELDSTKTASRQNALESLASLCDPGYIPALADFATRHDAAAGAAIVSALDKMPQQEATNALVTLSVYGEDESVRLAAASALSSRSFYGYVPTLLRGMESPVQIVYRPGVGSTGGHELTLIQKTMTGERRFVSVGAPDFVVSIALHPKTGRAPDVSLRRAGIDPTAAADRALALQTATENVLRDELNKRVATVLQTSTGESYDQSPSRWWNWWYDYNEMYQPKTVQVAYRSYVPTEPIGYSTTCCSCFVAGTPVWTETGPTAIEQIKAGDCVLAQNIETGELSYKPVLTTTVRPPSALLAVTVNGDSLYVTRGHPFWVDGVGWLMAKQLQAGQRVHSVAGPVEIENVQPRGSDVCYNLVVDDFATYFVGEAKILVHDNNLRQVTSATVPGLVETP